MTEVLGWVWQVAPPTNAPFTSNRSGMRNQVLQHCHQTEVHRMGMKSDCTTSD
jgi:hypothetical protein